MNTALRAYASLLLAASMIGSGIGCGGDKTTEPDPGTGKTDAGGANYKLDKCLDWSTHTINRVDTFGLTLSKRRLFSGKLDLSGSAIVSLAETLVRVKGGSYANATFTQGGVNYTALFIPTADLPAVTTNSLELRLSGQYHIDKHKSVRMGYSIRRLKVVDYAYDALQVGGNTKEDLPTYQQAPTYTIQSVGLAFVSEF